MVHIGHPFRGGMIGDRLGRAKAADPAAVDLDVAHAAKIDQMFGHLPVMGSLAACDPDPCRRGTLRERVIGRQRLPAEGLLEEGDPVAFHGLEPGGSRFHVLDEHLPRIDQENAVGPQPLAGSIELKRVTLGRLPERRPAEFCSLKTLLADVTRPLEGLRRGGAEKDRGIGQLRPGAGIAEKFPGRFAPRLSQQIPERHLDPGPGVRGLQQIHRIIGHIGSDGVDILGRVQIAPEDRRRDGPAGAMRHGRHECGNGYQRRGLAFAPADQTSGRDPDDKRILAAVRCGCDLRHRQIEEIHAFDFHD